MNNYAYYNGTVSAIEELMIPANDRSTYFGDGVYEAALVLNKKIFSLQEHLDRLYNSCKMLRIDFEIPRQELSDLLQQAVDSIDADDSFLYWQITRGTGARKHAFCSGKPNLLITCTPQGLKSMAKPYKLLTVEDTRFFHCNIKTLNLIPNVMATQQAVESGCDEVVFHRGDIVTECAHSNVSMLKDGALYTAPTDEFILPGITRAHLVSCCKELGIPVHEEKYTLAQLMEADEVIVSGTTIHFVPANEIDGKSVGGKAPELLHALQELYAKRVETQTGIWIL